MDRTNSSNITVREGLQEIEKWKPALTDDQWRNANLVVIDDQVQDKLICTLTASGKFKVAEYVNKFTASRPKKEWSDMVWNKYTSYRVNAFNWSVQRSDICRR